MGPSSAKLRLSCAIVIQFDFKFGRDWVPDFPQWVAGSSENNLAGAETQAKLDKNEPALVLKYPSLKMFNTFGGILFLPKWVLAKMIHDDPLRN